MSGSMIQNHRMLARPGLRKDFRDAHSKWEPIFNQFLKEGSTDEQEISAATVVGPNRLYQSGELEPVRYQSMRSGRKVSAVGKTYKGGYFLSKEAILRDKYGKLNQGAKWLAEAAMYTKEYDAAAMINDAFNGTTYKGMDGLALCHTAHTLLGSTSTVGNTPAAAVSLTVAGFTAMMDLSRKMKNENYDPIIMMPDTLMIANDQSQLQKAQQILESNLEPFTANNQDNPIKRNFKPKKIIVNPYMANLYHWFTIDSTKNDSHFLNTEALNMKDWYDDEVDASKVKARAGWITWFYDWRAWAGSSASA